MGSLRRTANHEKHADYRLRRRVDRSQRKLETRDEVSAAGLHLVLHGESPLGTRCERGREPVALHQSRVSSELLQPNHRHHDLDPSVPQHHSRRGTDLQLLHGRREADSVSMQAGLQDAAVMRTKNRTRRAFVYFVFFVTFVVGVLRELVIELPTNWNIPKPDPTGASAGRTIRLGSIADGHTTAVPLEVYVARVLAGEADPKAGDAAQQALAIAIRTYTLKNV